MTGRSGACACDFRLKRRLRDKRLASSCTPPPALVRCLNRCA